jgi:hypothetical protein
MSLVPSVTGRRAFDSAIRQTANHLEGWKMLRPRSGRFVLG